MWLWWLVTSMLGGDLQRKAAGYILQSTHSVFPCVVYRARCGYWPVQTRVCVCVCKWVSACVCELESPWVLFVLIKQQLYGTLDTLDQTPSHYWNITRPWARGLHPVYASACQRCVWVGTFMCVCVCVCILICTCRCVIVQLWRVLYVFTHGVVSGLTVPSQYAVCVCSLSAGVLIDPHPVRRILEYVKA